MLLVTIAIGSLWEKMNYNNIKKIMGRGVGFLPGSAEEEPNVGPVDVKDTTD